nr:putative ribonuclease H-like domain-containing protein [Tanacetum cinerariifolium]
GNSQIVIDNKGYWDSGFSRHMTGNISYLLDYEPYHGGYVSFGQGGCKITGKRTIKIDESMLWHRRLGHWNFKTMNRLVGHNLVKGLPSKCFDNDHTCVAYLKGKQHKASCKTKLVNSVSKPLYTLHMDMFGPTFVSSLNHKWYCLVVTDDFFGFTLTFFLKTKDETSGILRNFITEIKNLKDLNVKIIRCDNGGEFRNKEMNDFRSRKGIKREFNNGRTPQQNRVAERRNKTLIEAARTMVLVNKSQNKTLYELFNGRTPAIGFLKLFRCHVMILNTLDHLGKFEAKGDAGYFIGCSMSSKAFRVFNKRTKRVEENLYVDFLENKIIEKAAGPNWLYDIDTLTNSMNYVPVVSAETTSTNFSGTKDAASQDVKKDMSSLRYIALPNWFHKAHLESSTSNAQDACKVDVPESSGNSNPTATSTNPSADQIETLTMETPIPTVSSPVPTACLDDSPQLSSYTRLISKRVTSQDDTPSLDNILTLSNRIEAIRLFLAYASFMGFTVYQMNVKSAFLYGTIDEEVYVMQPPGFQDPEFLARVYKVEKAMCGLHQALRAWYGTLSKYLLTNGFQRGTIDQTLFIRKHRGDFILVQVYVDDIIFGSSNPQLCREFKALMHEKFQMSAMGKLNFFLGLQVLQKKDGIFLSQDKYVGDILKKFGYSDVRSANTPMDKENPWGKDGTRIWYPKDSPFDLVAYSDSDYDGATQDRKSTTGGCQFLGRRLILWQCKKQIIVATSTTEAEYVAAASGYGQVL